MAPGARIAAATGVDRATGDPRSSSAPGPSWWPAGYVWSSHLLLCSPAAGYPDGLANRSGLVGKYLSGHRNVGGFISLPLELFPGINEQHSLVTKKFMRRVPGRVGTSATTSGSGSRRSAGSRGSRGPDGRLLLGDELLADWRRRAATGTARVRAYYDVIPDRESALTLDPVAAHARGAIRSRCSTLARRPGLGGAARAERSGDPRAVRPRWRAPAMARCSRPGATPFRIIPRAGAAWAPIPATSVTDAWGRTHDHENLFVAGAPTCVSASCANGTLTFCALALRSAAEIGKEFPARQ